MLTANLLPMSRRRASAREDRIVAWTIGIGLLACALGVATAAIRISTRSSTAAATARELAGVDAELAQLATLVDESKSRAQKAESHLAAARAIADHPDWSLLLNLLGTLRGDHIDLARIALGYGKPDANTNANTNANANAKPDARPARGYWIRITGQALDQAAVARFAVRLEGAGLFDKVTLTESRKGAAENALVEFQIDASIDDVGGAR
jgi:Tfp pilus assembly protein PilN